MKSSSTIILETDESVFKLIGIHTKLDDYKLAYLTNKALKTKFKRKYTYETPKKENICNVFYEYTNGDAYWILFSNLKFNKEIEDFSLFYKLSDYVIPEYEGINFFIKIYEEEDFNFTDKILTELKKVDEIKSPYLIDNKTIKSEDFLIF